MISRSVVASIWFRLAWGNTRKSSLNESNQFSMCTTQMRYLQNMIAILRPLHQTVHKLLQSLGPKCKHLQVQRLSTISHTKTYDDSMLSEMIKILTFESTDLRNASRTKRSAIPRVRWVTSWCFISDPATKFRKKIEVSFQVNRTLHLMLVASLNQNKAAIRLTRRGWEQTDC